ncbi:MAG TPA: hypothetical protein VFU15_02595 [Bacteroidia bacterium]|nr:hypothetical protein [Bacteroidia bacterium]
MRCIPFFVLWLTFSLCAQAQDSAQTIPAKKYSVKPAFDFDQRFSFIRDKKVNIWGERGGVLINEKFKVGVGVYFLKDKLKSLAVDTSGPLYTGKRNLYFGTMYFEPFVFRFKFVEFSVPFEAGFGKSIFQVYSSSTNELLNTTKRDFLPTGAGLSLSFKLPPAGRFKPTRWIGINFLAGYRYCVLQNYFQTDYNGMFWSVSGAIFLDRVTDDCREWNHARKQRKADRPDNSKINAG